VERALEFFSASYEPGNTPVFLCWRASRQRRCTTSRDTTPDNLVRGVERFRDRQSQRFLSADKLGRLPKAIGECEAAGVNAKGLNLIRLLARFQTAWPPFQRGGSF